MSNIKQQVHEQRTAVYGTADPQIQHACTQDKSRRHCRLENKRQNHAHAYRFQYHDFRSDRLQHQRDDNAYEYGFQAVKNECAQTGNDGRHRERRNIDHKHCPLFAIRLQIIVSKQIYL